MKTLEQITELLTRLDDDQLISCWNEYQAETNSEQEIYDFDDDFFEIFFSNPAEAARAVYFGEIESWNDPYIQFNGYGNLVSTNNPIDMISIYDLANHIERNQDDYEELLEGIEEQD